MRRSLPLPLVLSLILASAAAAQGPLPQTETRLPWVHDSGDRANPGSTPAVVHSHLISIPGAPSLRCVFDEVSLGAQDRLEVSSPVTGLIHRLDAAELRHWQATSAYFNGDTLLLQLVVMPGSRASFRMHEVIAGVIPPPQDSLCGSDNRTASTDNRSLRLLPVGCTIWVASANNCGCTAGHCTIYSGSVAQANVPNSTSSGAIQHPAPSDQFPVSNLANGGQSLGNDWRICRLGSSNGTTAAARFGSFVVSFANPTSGTTVRITGYGTDSTPLTASQTNQTSTGPYAGSSGSSTVYHQVDTEGGNSGSPVIAASGSLSGKAYAIHTNGGCTSTGGANAGTSCKRNAFKSAYNTHCTGAATVVPPPEMFLEFHTGGGGVGDLVVEIDGVPEGTVEGFTVFSLDTSLPVGQGALAGLGADALAIACVTAPAAPGGLAHWTWPAGGLYPATPFEVPAGSLTSLAGLQIDARAAALGPGGAPVTLTDVERITF